MYLTEGKTEKGVFRVLALWSNWIMLQLLLHEYIDEILAWGGRRDINF